MTPMIYLRYPHPKNFRFHEAVKFINSRKYTSRYLMTHPRKKYNYNSPYKPQTRNQKIEHKAKLNLKFAVCL